jgi:Domain of Unknown Function with PDB structure (DUF3857)
MNTYKYLSRACINEALGSPRQLILSTLLCLFALFSMPPIARAGEDWLPVTQEELKMTSEPKAPGAPAIYLYRQIDRDDAEFHEYYYARIKIFTEEGRKYADIEIPFVKGFGNVKGIQARTIHPDGSIVNFDGRVYEKMIVKAKGVKILAKTFTMPDVQAGSIIEYRFTRVLPDYLFGSHWLLSEELFTKHAKFSLRPNTGYALHMSWRRGLPEGTNPPVEDHQLLRLETQNVPAFQIEDYMPPLDEMKYRVDFTYTQSAENDVAKFWNEEAKQIYREIDSFTNKPKAMERAVAQTITPTDPPEQKLQEIYARCQKLRNTTFEYEKTEQERNREKLKNIENVEDVWKRGYGSGSEITWLFLALAHAAGFDASPVLVSTRDIHFFNPKLMNRDDLNTNVVLVKLNSKDLYLDPGTAFAPFGLLPWHETGVMGLRVDKDGGNWIVTTNPGPRESGIEREARLQLDDSGSLDGKATITFKGLSALSRRIEENEEDPAQRRKFLEDEIKRCIPAPVEAELTNTPAWNSSSTTLVAEYHLKIPGWASVAGHHTVLSVGVFGNGEKHVFDHTARVHPVYFNYAYQDQDDVTIELPAGWQVSSLPMPQNIDGHVVLYHTDAQNNGGSLHVTRQLTVNMLMLDTKYYGALRNFYQQVRTGDEQAIVLSSVASAAQE